MGKGGGMMELRLSRAGWLVLGLAAAGVAVFGWMVPRPQQPTQPQVTEAPACTSCDARHARLANIRPEVTEGTE
jgi:hypothetical protein